MFSVWGGKRWGWGYNKLKKLVLFFHKVGPGTWTQFSRLGSMCLYLLSHLICPKNISFADEQVIQKYQWWSEIRTSLCAQLQGPASSSLVPCPCHLQMLEAHISSATVKDTFSFFPFLFLGYVWGWCKLWGGVHVCVCVYVYVWTYICAGPLCSALVCPVNHMSTSAAIHTRTNSHHQHFLVFWCPL